MKERILELVKESAKLSESAGTLHERAIADTVCVFLSAAVDAFDRKFTIAEVMTPSPIRSMLEIRRVLDIALSMLSMEIPDLPDIKKKKKEEIHFGVN